MWLYYNITQSNLSDSKMWRLARTYPHHQIEQMHMHYHFINGKIQQFHVSIMHNKYLLFVA